MSRQPTGFSSHSMQKHTFCVPKGVLLIPERWPFISKMPLVSVHDVILLIAGYRQNCGIIIKHMLYVGITLPYICLKNRK